MMTVEEKGKTEGEERRERREREERSEGESKYD
jgi:hypothetical protein